MKDELKTYYQAYRLVKVFEPHLEREWQGRLDKYHGKRNSIINGKYYLELLIESEKIEEILELVPAVEMYLQNTNLEEEIVLKPFTLNEMEEVSFLNYRIEGGLQYIIVSGRRYHLSSQGVFSMIYRTYNKDVIIIMNSWLAGSIKEMQLHSILRREERKEHWRQYDLEFVI